VAKDFDKRKHLLWLWVCLFFFQILWKDVGGLAIFHIAKFGERQEKREGEKVGTPPIKISNLLELII